MTNQVTDLTLVVGDDGFADGDAGDRLIQGEVIRCVDGHWTDRDKTPIPPDTTLIALSTAEAAQRWEGKLPVETKIKRPGVSLPDVDELNAKIPKKQWEEGLDGQKRAPWVHQYAVYLLDPRDASMFTFINSTVGARIAVERLKDKVKWMRALRGEKVVPIVKLDAKPMPTKKGQKQRPEFTILEWRDFGGLSAATTVPAIEHLSQPVKPVTTAELMDDEIPTYDDDSVLPDNVE
jgi:hypothetical protein